MSWYKVETSMGELLEYNSKPSMRKIKSDLQITGKRCKLISACGYYLQFKMLGAKYTFTITECA